MALAAHSDRTRTSAAPGDLERFRLRNFLALVDHAGELDTVFDPIDLIDIVGLSLI